MYLSIIPQVFSIFSIFIYLAGQSSISVKPNKILINKVKRVVLTRLLYRSLFYMEPCDRAKLVGYRRAAALPPLQVPNRRPSCRTRPSDNASFVQQPLLPWFYYTSSMRLSS